MWEEDSNTDVLDKDDIDIQEPKDWALLLINDNYTTMEFVTKVLVDVCRKSEDEAVKIMLDVHQKGKGLGYIGIQDIVQTKQVQIAILAKQAGYPLRTEIQEA